ncbi:MAG TPA: hypothetical protein VMU35_08765 [Methylomirabilota bacterium]|nr:hypothetical protein [Methylomirabilota bacterium]
MKIGRFQVMAILQAARAKQLGLPINEAKSWGLNRAIFYAAAKRGFKGKAMRSKGPETSMKAVEGKKLRIFSVTKWHTASSRAANSTLR